MLRYYRFLVENTNITKNGISELTSQLSTICKSHHIYDNILDMSNANIEALELQLSSLYMETLAVIYDNFAKLLNYKIEAYDVAKLPLTLAKMNSIEDEHTMRIFLKALKLESEYNVIGNSAIYNTPSPESTILKHFLSHYEYVIEEVRKKGGLEQPIDCCVIL